MEYVSSERKLLPYGMMNFADIRLDNYYYVDKTSFIPVIEQSDRFFFSSARAGSARALR